MHILMKNELTSNKQITINIVGSIFAVLANVLISFFLSPYIVRVLGVEANGFVSLANNFISYATLVTIALNSMAGRFIAIEIQQNHLEAGNKYYTSVFVGNIVLVSIFLLPAVFMLWKLERIINIPDSLAVDVKTLFLLIFLTFFINTGVPKWDTATYVKNKLYLRSLRSIESGIIRVGIIVLLFVIFKPSVYFVGAAAMGATLFENYFAYYYKVRLLPELRIRRHSFDVRAVRELITSGIWNAVSNSGKVLLEGLDLLIANVFVGPTAMGLLAIAKTIPNLLTQIIGSVAVTFGPVLIADYAKGDFKSIESQVKKSIKIMEILVTVPLGIIIIFGFEFFTLWVPSLDAKVLQILSLLSCFFLVFTSGIQCLYNIFTVTNKLKFNSILTVASGVVSTGIVIILLKTTSLGIYAIAGVSSFVLLVKDLLLVVPYAAKCLDIKWTSFYREILYSIPCVLVSSGIGFLLRQIITIDSWLPLIAAVLITGVIGIILDVYIILNRNERKYIAAFVMEKVSRKGR